MAVARGGSSVRPAPACPATTWLVPTSHVSDVPRGSAGADRATRAFRSRARGHGRRPFPARSGVDRGRWRQRPPPQVNARPIRPERRDVSMRVATDQVFSLKLTKERSRTWVARAVDNYRHGRQVFAWNGSAASVLSLGAGDVFFACSRDLILALTAVELCRKRSDSMPVDQLRC